jgi:hypothetical protein
MNAIGQVYLDGLRFTTDPKVYEASWPKRHSIHEGLAGSVTIQDFGVRAKDLAFRLGSDGQYLDLALVDQLDARFRTLGATYVFKDWRETEATVFITRFAPRETFLPDLYEYEMELRALALTKLRGVAYSGT